MWKRSLSAGLLASTVLLGPISASGLGPAAAVDVLPTSSDCLRLNLVGAATDGRNYDHGSPRLAAAGDMAAIAESGRMWMADLSQPGAIELSAPVYTGGSGVIGVSGRRAFTRLPDGLAAVDFSDPGAPTVRPLDFGPVDVYTTSAAMSGTGHMVAVGEVLVPPMEQAAGGLMVLDVHSATAPVVVGFLPLANATNLAVRDGFAYVVAGDRLVVVGLGRPDRPQVVAETAALGGPPEVAGRYELFAGPRRMFLYAEWPVDAEQRVREQRLGVLDTSAPARPVGPRWLTGLRVRPLAAAGDMLVLSRLYSEVGWAVDASDIEQPSMAPLEIPRPGIGWVAAVEHNGRLLFTGQDELLRVYDYRRRAACSGAPPPPPTPERGAAVARLSLPLVLRGAAIEAGAPLGRVIGQYGGDPSAAALDGYTAYLALGDGLTVLDVTDPDRPRTLAAGLPLRAEVVRIEAVDDLVVAVSTDGYLQVFDVTDPARPSPVATAKVASRATGMLAAGRRLFVIGSDFVSEVSLDARGAPSLVRCIAPPAQQVAYAMAGGRLYGLSATEIWSFDPESGTTRRRPGLLPDGATPAAVVGTATHLFVSRDGEMWVLDVRDQVEPRVVSHLVTGAEFSHSAGDLLYGLTAKDLHLLLFDISTPASPVRRGGLAPDLYWAVSAVSPDRALLTHGITSPVGPYLIDASDPAAPRLASRLDGPVLVDRIVAQGEVAYTLGHRAREWSWRIIDASHPEAPIDLGPVLPTDHYPLHTFGPAAVRRGTTLYVAVVVDDAAPGRLTGIDVLDVTVPRQPRLLRTMAPPFGEGMSALAADARYVYHAEARSARGKVVLDILDPDGREAGPRLGTITLDADDHIVPVLAARDGLVYVSTGAGLAIVDARSAEAPREAARLAFGRSIHALAVDGARLYALSADAGASSFAPSWWLAVLDLGDPLRPRVLGWTTAGSGLWGDMLGAELAVAGHWVFVSAAPYGIDAIDVSDPTRPRRAAELPLASMEAGWPDYTTAALATAGDRLYAARDTSGLVLFDVSGTAAWAGAEPSGHATARPPTYTRRNPAAAPIPH